MSAPKMSELVKYMEQMLDNHISSETGSVDTVALAEDASAHFGVVDSRVRSRCEFFSYEVVRIKRNQAL